ncbi:serine hydrolase domain-containing protein [Jiangella gansuensis]|uniref:serine hydrolase domain-containing protein n=1 Tax=Jiangella gansuensis TaxID=281473 RepID=UPI00047ED6D6|nr:serine hydrolase domain-containing protein [Jiangella gansuensis]
MRSVQLVDQWPVDHAATAVVGADGGLLGTHGDQDRPFSLASVTKPLTAYATLIAVEEGAIGLDDPAGPEGSTVRHLLAHTSGLAFDEHKVAWEPGARRLYSNAGFEQLADAVAKRSGIPFADYVRDGLLTPLGMTGTTFEGSPASGATSTVRDLARFAAELQSPALLDPATVQAATTVAFPGLSGVLPGYGRQDPNDWGLGFEIRADKSPHWTGSANSPRTFGHFGQAGTFLWVDPELGAACVALADRDFGPWAVEAWPPFSDAVVAELTSK